VAHAPPKAMSKVELESTCDALGIGAGAKFELRWSRPLGLPTCEMGRMQLGYVGANAASANRTVLYGAALSNVR